MHVQNHCNHTNEWCHNGTVAVMTYWGNPPAHMLLGVTGCIIGWTLVMAPKSVTHDHLVSVLFGELLSHSYNITFSMFLYLVVLWFYLLSSLLTQGRYVCIAVMTWKLQSKARTQMYSKLSGYVYMCTLFIGNEDCCKQIWWFEQYKYTSVSISISTRIKKAYTNYFMSILMS